MIHASPMNGPCRAHAPSDRPICWSDVSVVMHGVKCKAGSFCLSPALAWWLVSSLGGVADVGSRLKGNALLVRASSLAGLFSNFATLGDQ